LGVVDTPDNALVRFELDSAVSGLGNYVDAKLQEYTPKGKRKYTTLAAVFALADVKPKPKSIKSTVSGFPKMDIKRRVTHGD